MYIPVGTAIHTGEAFVGATSPGTTVDDFTALGDAVNITARLASSADAGEVIVSVAAAEAADIATEHRERRTVGGREWPARRGGGQHGRWVISGGPLRTPKDRTVSKCPSVQRPAAE